MLHPQRLQIIRVVITGAQHKASQHDTALYLRAESLRPGLLVHSVQLLGPSGAVPVFNAVKTLQVRAGLRGGNGVICRDGVFCQPQVKLFQNGPRFPQCPCRFQDSLPDLRVRSFPSVFRYIVSGNPDAHSLHILLQGRDKIPQLSGHPCGIPPILPVSGRKDFQNHGTVFHSPAKGSDLIQGRSVSHQPIAGNRAVSRLHAYHAAMGSGLPDRSAGIGSYGKETFPCRHGRSGAP